MKELELFFSEKIVFLLIPRLLDFCVGGMFQIILIWLSVCQKGKVIH